MSDAVGQSHKRKAGSTEFIPSDTAYAAMTLNRKAAKMNSSSTPRGLSGETAGTTRNVDVQPIDPLMGSLTEASERDATTALGARVQPAARSDRSLEGSTANKGKLGDEAQLSGDDATVSKISQPSEPGPRSPPNIERSYPSPKLGVPKGLSSTAKEVETDPTATPPSKSPSNELGQLSALMAPLEFYLPLDKFMCPWITSRNQDRAWLPPFHVCAEREFIQNFKEHVSQVEVYNPFLRHTSHVQSLGTGVVRIEVVGMMGDKVQVTLENVHHIPALGCNIFCPSAAGSRLNGLAVEWETAGEVSNGKEWFALQTCRRDYMVLKGQAVQFDGTPVVRDFAPWKEERPPWLRRGSETTIGSE